jgi:hypothetical protein
VLVHRGSGGGVKAVLLLGLVVGVVLFGIVGGVQASALDDVTPPPGTVLDQSNPPRDPPCNVSGWLPDDSNSWAAQTFTPARDGVLTDVVLPLKGTNTQFNLAITPVDVSGAPVIGAALATTTVAFTPTDIPKVYPNLDIHFPTPATVKVETQYAIVLTAPNESPDNFIAWKYDAGSSETDSKGTPCADGAYGAGRAWGHDTQLPTPDADFFFYTFVIPIDHVTVEKSGAGTGTVVDGTGALNCGTTCTAGFPQGQTVQLTATPDALSVFKGWSGACSGATPTCALTLSADASVTAVFAVKTFRLTVRKTGAGSVASSPAGITCGRRCSALFTPGRVVLTAKPAASWRFAHWRGACRGTAKQCRLTLQGPAATSAIFAKRPKAK